METLQGYQDFAVTDCNYSARDQMGVQLQVFILNFLQLDTHVIRTPLARAIIASFAMFPTVFTTYKSATDIFAQNEVSKRHF